VSADHPWVPRATCDSSCVHTDAAAGHSVVVAWRIAVRATFAVLLLSALPLLAIPLPGRSHIQRGYCRMMLRCLGVRITVSGGPIRNLRGVLVVSGHVSWVDIFAIGAVMPGSFVAKAELISWPGLGIAARLMKVIPIEREQLRRLPDVVGAVAGRLCAGQTVVAFPEGDNLVRTGLRPVPPGDVPGRRGRGQAGAAAAAELSPSRWQSVDAGRVRRRRHLDDLDPQAGHGPAHGRPCAGRVIAAARDLAARSGGPVRSRGPRRRFAARPRSRPGGLTSDSGPPVRGG
jgi:1-acyl-sn-glycerol-3-phosphate acyltransferase